MITMTTQLRNLIVNKHNVLRNRVAKGFSKFKPAARMATMRWHSELAKLAELNVKRCVMEHDQCRNTPQFRYSGQNLAETYSTGSLDMQATLTNQMQSWFDEYKDTPVSLIQSYKSPNNGYYIGTVEHGYNYINGRCVFSFCNT